MTTTFPNSDPAVVEYCMPGIVKTQRCGFENKLKAVADVCSAAVALLTQNPIAMTKELSNEMWEFHVNEIMPLLRQKGPEAA